MWVCWFRLRWFFWMQTQFVTIGFFFSEVEGEGGQINCRFFLTFCKSRWVSHDSPKQHQNSTRPPGKKKSEILGRPGGGRVPRRAPKAASRKVGSRTVGPKNGGSKGGAPKGGGPNLEKVGPRGWAPKGGAPKGGAPKAGGPKILRFFSVSRSLFLPSLGGRFVEVWWCLKRWDPQMCTYGVLGLSFETPAKKERNFGRSGSRGSAEGNAQILDASMKILNTQHNTTGYSSQGGLGQGGSRAGRSMAQKTKHEQQIVPKKSSIGQCFF